DPGEHLHRLEVDVRSLPRPRVDDAVDLVGIAHPAIIACGMLADSVCDPLWCNGSTTAFGAVRSRFESWRRSHPGKDDGVTTWFITGCSTGLGRALAAAVLERGDSAIMTARDVATLDEIVAA